MPATYEDANLIVQLVRWETDMNLQESVRQLNSDAYDPATASAHDKDVSRVLMFGETLSTLVKHRILDRELVLDLWWVTGLWSRVAGPATRMREQLGEPRLYENFEALAQSVLA